MDSSSLLQLHSQRVNQSNQDPKLLLSKTLDLCCSIPDYELFDPATKSPEDNHLVDLLCDAEQSNVDALKLSIPMPNFLIDPQDGQFTPYLERSPVSTPDQEYDQLMYFNHTDSSPDSVLSPLRSRATSIAVKKLMETQAQMLLDISAAWKKKYPVELCHRAQCIDANDKSSTHTGHAQPLPTNQTSTLFPANPIFLSSSQTPRRSRSMTHKSSDSLLSVFEQLSLRDCSDVNLATNVEAWKHDALQFKLKEEATKTWIKCLPPSEEFQDPCESL